MKIRQLDDFSKAVVLILVFICVVSDALRIKDSWNSRQFYKFLAKFGIQKTNAKDVIDTGGFIYGNITSDDVSNVTTPMTLVLVDSEYFLEFFTNSSSAHNKSCEWMFKKINTIAYDSTCNQYGKEDFLRRIPCRKGQLCIDEDAAENVLPGYQFTYKVQDFQAPRFWYISIVSCYRNLTAGNCSWVRNDNQAININYDIWMVNGDPASKHLNPFEHQFSFEEHDIFECYLVYLIIYLFVIPTWIYAFWKQRHPITKLFTSAICLEVTGILLNFMHVLVFSRNGVGVFVFATLGNAIDTVAQCLFMLFLLFIARGWTITHLQLKGRLVVFAVWGTYTLSNCVLYFWTLTEIDVISNVDEWQTWPGYITLGLRVIIMVWFVVELRRTVYLSKFPDSLTFLQQFGAFFLVWFIYLPILAIISTQISALWKHKTILAIINGADLLANMVMIHLLWPSNSILILIKSPDAGQPTYDLEVTGLLDEDEELFTASHIRRGPDHKTNGYGPIEIPRTDLTEIDKLVNDESTL